MADNSKPVYWAPDPATILRLYTEMDKGPGWLELDWKCPGRRPPTPPDERDKVVEEEVPEDDGKDLAFDFEDEFASTGAFDTPQQRRPLGGALKGSARKKTTSLDGVLSNMRRHKIIEDNMEEPEKKEAS